MRYKAEFIAPRPFFMTRHLQAWMIIDTQDPRSLDGYQIAMCATKLSAETIALVLNQGNQANG